MWSFHLPLSTRLCAKMKSSQAAMQLLLERLPLRRTPQTCPSCKAVFTQRRAFSHAPGRRKEMGAMQFARNKDLTKVRDQMMSQSQQIKNAKANQIPTDVGLLPSVFVSPGVLQLYRMYKGNTKRLLAVLWLRFKQAPSTVFMCVYVHA
jgi:hypothetical protein